MPIEKHNLVDELPEFKEDIHNLKMSDSHFKKLFDKYHFLTNEIEKMEREIVPATTVEEENFKKERLLIKDTIVGYIKASIRAEKNKKAVA